MPKVQYRPDVIVETFIKNAERITHNPANFASREDSVKALEEHTRAFIEERPDNISLHEYYAVCLLRQNKTDEAKSHWKNLIENDPSNTELNLKYSTLLVSAFTLGQATKSEITVQAENTYRLDLNNEEKIELNELMIFANSVGKQRKQNLTPDNMPAPV